jgi:hypothetical protein
MLTRSDAQMIDAVQKAHLRTRILMLLRDLYPRTMQTRILQGVLEKMHCEVCLNEIRFEAEYLAEKNLLANKVSKDGKSIQVRITARGIDFLEGSIEEVGLANPAEYS